MNQVVLVGKIADTPKMIDNKTIVAVAVKRNFKNSKGGYDIDVIDCILWNKVASATTKYCEKGDTIGIKGRLEVANGELLVIAERVTFISSKKEAKSYDKE